MSQSDMANCTHGEHSQWWGMDAVREVCVPDSLRPHRVTRINRCGSKVKCALFPWPMRDAFRGCTGVSFTKLTRTLRVTAVAPVTSVTPLNVGEGDSGGAVHEAETEA